MKTSVIWCLVTLVVLGGCEFLASEYHGKLRKVKELRSKVPAAEVTDFQNSTKNCDSSVAYKVVIKNWKSDVFVLDNQTTAVLMALENIRSCRNVDIGLVPELAQHSYYIYFLATSIYKAIEHPNLYTKTRKALSRSDLLTLAHHAAQVSEAAKGSARDWEIKILELYFKSKSLHGKEVETETEKETETKTGVVYH